MPIALPDFRKNLEATNFELQVKNAPRKNAKCYIT